MTRVRPSVFFVLGTIVALRVLPLGAIQNPPNSDFAKLCQKGGWINLVRTNGTGFTNEEACVSYAARGNTLVQAPPSVSVSYTPTFDPTFCSVTVNLAHFAANTLYPLTVTVLNQSPFHGDTYTSFPGYGATTDNSGAASVFLFSYSKADNGGPNLINVTAGGVSSGFQQVIC